MVQLQLCARHMVIRGHEPQAVIGLCAGPAGDLLGIADGIGGFAPQVNAAAVEWLKHRLDAQQIGKIGAFVYARNQQAFAFAVRQQMRRGADAFARTR